MNHGQHRKLVDRDYFYVSSVRYDVPHINYKDYADNQTLMVATTESDKLHHVYIKNNHIWALTYNVRDYFDYIVTVGSVMPIVEILPREKLRTCYSEYTDFRLATMLIENGHHLPFAQWCKVRFDRTYTHNFLALTKEELLRTLAERSSARTQIQSTYQTEDQPMGGNKQKVNYLIEIHNQNQFYGVCDYFNLWSLEDREKIMKSESARNQFPIYVAVGPDCDINGYGWNPTPDIFTKKHLHDKTYFWLSSEQFADAGKMQYQTEFYGTPTYNDGRTVIENSETGDSLRVNGVVPRKQQQQLQMRSGLEFKVTLTIEQQ